MTLPKLRTVAECRKEILKLDEGSIVCEYYIRKLCENNLVKHFKSGKKLFVNFDDLIRYLSDEESEVPVCM